MLEHPWAGLSPLEALLAVVLSALLLFFLGLFCAWMAGRLGGEPGSRSRDQSGDAPPYVYNSGAYSDGGGDGGD